MRRLGDFLRSAAGRSLEATGGRSVTARNRRGRNVGGNIILEPEALPVPAAGAHSGADLHAGVQPLSESEADQDKPKLCPDSSKETGSAKWSKEAREDQALIAGLPLGYGVEFDGVGFDGCGESDGTMLEAKSIHYQKFMVGDAEWGLFYTGADKIKNQAEQRVRSSVTKPPQPHWVFNSPKIFSLSPRSGSQAILAGFNDVFLLRQTDAHLLGR